MRKSCVVHFILICFIVGILLISCSRNSKNEPELRVGFIIPETGKMGSLGTSMLEGAKLAIEEENKDGGIGVEGKKYKVIMIIKDSQDRPEFAVNAAHELINQENVSAIVGPSISSQAIPVAKVSSKALVPMITPIATHPDVTKHTRCVFRACFTDDFQGMGMARIAREELGAQRAAVLFDIASAYNRGLAEVFKQSFEELGGKVVAFETYITREDNFIDQLIRIRSNKPDILFLPNYVYEIILQIEQVKELGIKTQIIGSDTMSSRNPEDISVIEGAFFSTHYSNDIPSEKVKRFVDAYQRGYGRMPAIAGALTYDAFGLLFQAVRDQHSIEPQVICKGLSEIERYEGVSGIIGFD